MHSFWDSKARENARYYVSSYREYDDQDWEDFWAWGETLADRYLAASGIEFRGDESVLDIGCGVGRFVRPFASRFGRVHGVDISEAMIEEARRRLAHLPNASFEVGNGVDLAGQQDASYDFVFSYIMFQHIPDPRITLAYIREIGRVLRPGGRAYFQINNSRPPGLRARLKLGTRLRRILSRRRAESPSSDPGGPSELDHPAWIGSRIDLADLERACARGGIEIERLDGEGTQYLWVRVLKP